MTMQLFLQLEELLATDMFVYDYQLVYVNYT